MNMNLRSNIGSDDAIDVYGYDQLSCPPGQVDESLGGVSYRDDLSRVSPKANQDIMESPHTLTNHEEHPMPSTYFNVPIPSALDHRDMDPSMTNNVELLHNMDTMGNAWAIPYWGLEVQTSKQSSPTVPIPSLSKNDPTIALGYPVLNTVCPIPQPDDLRSPVDPMHNEQEVHPRIAYEESADTGNLGGSAHSIGHVLDDGKFMCNDEECEGLTFARVADLRRHYTTLHAADKPNLWCQVDSCRRNLNGGAKPFHRKDKLLSHIRNMHPGVH